MNSVTGSQTVVGIDGLTPDWLTATLCSSPRFKEHRITAFVAEPAGSGQIARLLRLTLHRDSAEPVTVMAKTASRDATARAFAREAGLYAREVRFYAELSSAVPVSTPEVYYAALAPRGDEEFLIVFEDLQPAEQLDQVAGCTPDRAMLALEQAAKLHSYGWDSAELLSSDWLMTGAGMWKGAAAQVAPMLSVFRDRFSARIEDEYLAIGDRLVQEIDAWVARLDRPRCLWHADFRLDNMLFGAAAGKHPVAVLDWQTVTLGPPGLDIAFFLGSGLREDDRREHEESLVRGYHAALRDHGVRNYSWDACWRDYRMHAVCGFLGALIGAARAERSERGDEMLFSMARRHGAHVADLNAFEALEVA